MFCEHCGKPLVDPDLYCEHCGSPLPEGLVKQRLPGLVKSVGILTLNWLKRYKVVLICVLLLAALATGGFMVADYMKTVIDPTDYVSVQLSGYNSAGSVKIGFDEDYALTCRLMGLGQAEMEALDAAYDSEETKLAALVFFELAAREYTKIDEIFTVGYSLSGENGSLKNGDVLTVQVQVNQQLLETYGLHTLKPQFDVNYTIGQSGAKFGEPITVDLFEYVDVDITGYDPYGYLRVSAVDTTIPLPDPINGATAVRIVSDESLAVPERNHYPYIRFDFLDSGEAVLQEEKVRIQAEKTEDFRTGDSVQVSFPDGEKLEKHGVFLSDNTKEVTAPQLQQPVEVDFLACLEPVFSGVSPWGTMTWKEANAQYRLPLPETVSGMNEILVTLDDQGGMKQERVTVELHPYGSQEPETAVFYVFSMDYSELSNGDEAVVAFNDDYFAVRTLNMYGIDFVQEKRYSVTGLEEPLDLDVLGKLDCTAVKTGEGLQVTYGDPVKVKPDQEINGVQELRISGVRTGEIYDTLVIEVDRVDETGAQQTQKIEMNLGAYEWNGQLKLTAGGWGADIPLQKCGFTMTEKERLVPIETEPEETEEPVEKERDE